MAANDSSYFEQAPLLGAYSSGISVPSAPQEPVAIPEGLEMSYTPVETQVLEPPKLLGGETPVVRDRTVLQEEGFTVADALAAMEHHAQSKCCLKSKITHELNVIEMRVRSATHLTFESFTEGRSVMSDQAPYTPGTIVDGPQSGPAPAPWDIPAQPRALFQNDTNTYEVPHTSVVVGCDNCGRRGQVACTICVAGFRSCISCHGRGTVESHHHNSHNSHHSTSSTSSHHHHHHHHHSCHSCGGSGRTRCITCAGTGFVQCGRCRGSGLVRCFTKLTVQWRLYQNERVLDSGTLPHNLIQGAGGVTMFQEEDTVVRPVAHLPSAEINQAANELMGSQRITPNEQLQRQRIRIRSIPIYEVHYTYKGSERKTFWVYGTDRQVFEEHYPLCLPCTLL